MPGQCTCDNKLNRTEVLKRWNFISVTIQMLEWAQTRFNIICAHCYVCRLRMLICTAVSLDHTHMAWELSTHCSCGVRSLPGLLEPFCAAAQLTPPVLSQGGRLSSWQYRCTAIGHARARRHGKWLVWHAPSIYGPCTTCALIMHASSS